MDHVSQYVKYIFVGVGYLEVFKAGKHNLPLHIVCMQQHYPGQFKASKIRTCLENGQKAVYRKESDFRLVL